MAVPPIRSETSKKDVSKHSGQGVDTAGSRDNERDVRDLKHDFNSLLARYEKPLYNVIFQWVRDSEEAFDLTQETFISAYRASSNFRGEAKVYTWLYRIALNHCKNSMTGPEWGMVPMPDRPNPAPWRIGLWPPKL
jgi:uncharacterized protein YukE